MLIILLTFIAIILGATALCAIFRVNFNYNKGDFSIVIDTSKDDEVD